MALIGSITLISPLRSGRQHANPTNESTDKYIHFARPMSSLPGSLRLSDSLTALRVLYALLCVGVKPFAQSKGAIAPTVQQPWLLINPHVKIWTRNRLIGRTVQLYY